MSKQKIVLRHIPMEVRRDDILRALRPFGYMLESFRFEKPDDATLKFRKLFNLLVYNRCYLFFKNPNDIVEFKNSFNGVSYKTVDGKIRHKKLIVEYAPSQDKIVPEKDRMVDPRNNTIEEDEIFINFLANFNKKENENEKQILNEKKKDSDQSEKAPIIKACENLFKNRQKRNRHSRKNRNRRNRRNRKY
ncbi:hypothetical protein MHBO_000369 [Bonamia ostreae]|uniref:UPF3 domain-containing protein n=1 Tax=Bonamia ostreae TaxID=126728 RepID=A0ABV2AFG3_9EUKA